MGSDHCMMCFPEFQAAQFKQNCRNKVEQLAPNDQLLLVLLWYEELTVPEAAHMLGISEEHLIQRYEQIVGDVNSQLAQQSA